MNIRQLKDVLAQLQGLLADAGAKPQSAAVASVAAALDQPDSASVDQQLAQWSRNSDIATTYASRLEEAQADRSKYQAVRNEIERDPMVKKAEAIEIAIRYAKRKYASRKAALAALDARFQDRLRASNEADFLSKNRVSPY